MGVTLAAFGSGALVRGGVEAALVADTALFENDTLRTGEGSFAALRLVTEATINLGPFSEITLDAFTASLGGTLTLGGAMVFDRPDDLPPLDHTVLTAFAQIGVRGTRFFAGPSNGVPAIFCARGVVTVTRGQARVDLGPGEGIELPDTAAGSEDRLGDVLRWSEARIAAAYASVGL